jgi:hypothetical protein
MLSTLREVVNAILAKVPGKPDRLDTATRMSMDADFSPHGASEASPGVRRKGEATVEKPPDPDRAASHLIARLLGLAGKRPDKRCRHGVAIGPLGHVGIVPEEPLKKAHDLMPP